MPDSSLTVQAKCSIPPLIGTITEAGAIVFTLHPAPINVSVFSRSIKAEANLVLRQQATLLFPQGLPERLRKRLWSLVKGY